MKFCSSCGYSFIQESKAPRSRDFLKEFLNYDQHIWRTIKLLFSKPGTVTQAYMQGQGDRLTSPAKLFIIITAISFVLGSVSLTSSDDALLEQAPPLQEGQSKPPLELEITTSKGVEIKNIIYYRDEIDSLGSEAFMMKRGIPKGSLRFWVIKRTIKKYQKNNYQSL
ncbi:MAG TPA: DUF3667 domain-containing protein, partial [Roseivirga sp.]